MSIAIYPLRFFAFLKLIGIMTTTVTSINQSQSLASVRNFLRCAVTHIAYVRDLCPDSSFAFKDILGVKMRLLVPNHEQSIALVDSIENGVFDALRKGYLRELDLCIYNDDMTDVLESYVFLFEFSQDGKEVRMEIQSGGVGIGNDRSGLKRKEQTSFEKLRPNHHPKSASGHCSGEEARTILLRMLSQLTNFIDQLPPLNQKSRIGLRLLYHDSKTPSDYVPPGYADASPLMRLLYYKELRFNVPTSVSAATPHHYVGFSLRSATLASLRAQLLSDPLGEERKNNESKAEEEETNRTDRNRTQGESDEQITLPSSHTSFSTAPRGSDSVFLSPRMEKSAHLFQKDQRTQTLPTAGDGGGGDNEAAYADVGSDPIRGSAGNDANKILLTPILPERSACSATMCQGLTETELESAVGTSVKKRVHADEKREKHNAEEKKNGVCRIVDPLLAPSTVQDIPTLLELAASSRIYSRREVAFLLLALTVFSFAPNVPGGRGIITGREVQHFTTHSCALEVSEEWSFSSIHRLVSEGYLQCFPLTSPFSKKREDRLSTGQRWKVLSAPVSVIARLMQHEELKELMVPAALESLQKFLLVSNIASKKKNCTLRPFSQCNLDSKGMKNQMRRRKRTRSGTTFG